MGNTRAVVVNSFDDCKKMLLGNQNAVIDRPKLYTFHGVISSTQGFTIGSSPWDESCKKKRKAAGTAGNGSHAARSGGHGVGADDFDALPPGTPAVLGLCGKSA